MVGGICPGEGRAVAEGKGATSLVLQAAAVLRVRTSLFEARVFVGEEPPDALPRDGHLARPHDAVRRRAADASGAAVPAVGAAIVR